MGRVLDEEYSLVEAKLPSARILYTETKCYFKNISFDFHNFMAYFQKIDPFYEPNNEQQMHIGQDPRLGLRCFPNNYENNTPNGTPANSQGSWKNMVQGNENLFYTENTDNSSLHNQQQTESAYHSRQASYQSVGSYHSNNSDSPRQQPHARQNSQSSNRSSHSYSSAQRHSFGPQENHSHKEQFHRETSLRQSDQSYEGFSRNLNAHSDNGPIRSSQRGVPSKSSHGNNSFKNSPPTYSHSGKRKSVFMNPNSRNVQDVSKAQGVELCEKLFGIKLCHYKQKPPRPNGASMDMILRDRKVIVQGVVQDSQADICQLINRGDMLVGLNDNDLTWVNIDDMFRQAVHMEKVKLTFQVPVVVGPKSATPPVTPTRSTPPLFHTPPMGRQTPPQGSPVPPPVPPHVPLRSAHASTTQPARPPPPACASTRSSSKRLDLVYKTTGETRDSLAALLNRYLFAVMYLTFSSGQSENPEDDILYQYPVQNNKLTDVRGLFLTLAGTLPDVTGNTPRLTKVRYRGAVTHVCYWKQDRDVLLLCLPESRIPALYLTHIFSDMIKLLNLLYGSMQRVFRDGSYHGHLDELVSLVLYRVLQSGVQTQAIPHCNPLEPILLDTLTGVRWLRLNADDMICCDEILNEFEAQDFTEFDEYDQDERRKYGIVGSCLFYRDYLLCSHLSPNYLRDVHLYLKHQCILHLVSTQPSDDLLLWHEIYPTHLCQKDREDLPGYREPEARWFLLVLSLRNFLLCTVLEAGSYARPVPGQPVLDPFLAEHCKATLAQLDLEDTDMELQCNERLFSEPTGPTLKNIDADGPRASNDTVSPLKSTPSPRYAGDESISSATPNGPGMARQGSKMSYGSNDSSGSGNSLNKFQVRPPSKKGSMLDMDSVNRSFSRDSGKQCPDIRMTRGVHNQLLHYVHMGGFEGVYVSPSPYDLASVQGQTHEHVLYNFYAAALQMHRSFELQLKRMVRQIEAGVMPRHLEEGVMFTCHLPPSGDNKKQPTAAMYWVIGRQFSEGQELYVCLEDGAPQSLLEMAFAYNFGLT